MTTIQDIVKPYENKDICQKWNNNIPLAELDYLDCIITDSQDIQETCNSFPFLSSDEITGIVVTIGNGDYQEIYVTESSHPYRLDAIYHPLSYYLAGD